MSYGRAYTKNEIVMVDKGVWSYNPTLGPCTVECEVLTASVEAQAEVHVAPTDSEDGGPRYVEKNRVSP